MVVCLVICLLEAGGIRWRDSGAPTSGGLSQKAAQTSDAIFLWKFDVLEIGNLTVFKTLAKRM